MILRRWLTIFAVTLLSGCAGIGGTGQGKEMAGYENPVNIIDTQRLYQMDRTIVQDQAVIEYVERIRKRLETAHGEPCNCVVLVDSFGGYEAYSLSHKTVVVSAGVIAQADTEDEVAAVIAHELGHTYSRDNIKGLFQDAALYTVKAGGLALGAGGYTLILGQFVDDATRGLIYHQWNVDQEIEADMFALGLIAKAGYSPDGVKMAVRRLSEYGAKTLATRPDYAQECRKKVGNQIVTNAQACSKMLTGADASLYQDGTKRLKAVAEAATGLPAEQRRRRSVAEVPGFASVDYLFGMNALVSNNAPALKKGLAAIERQIRPASLAGNVAVSNKLAVAHAMAGNRDKAARYLIESFEARPRTAWTFNQLYKFVDRQGDPTAVERTLQEAHQEIGLMPALLPIEAYLAERHKLMVAFVFTTGRCLMTIVDDHKTLNLCDQFTKQAKAGKLADW